MEGIRVFIPDEKLVWVPATVLSVDASGKVFCVRVQPPASPSAADYEAVDAPAEERTVDLNDDGMPDSLPLQNVHDEDEDKDKSAGVGAEDMCELGHLHEPAIVYNVRERFFAREPYTYTGKIVVAVNPYQWIKEHYSEELRDLYTQRPWDEMPPHVYATSAEAFHHMKQHRIPQSILVSGESGAGKTETVKIMMEHLASISMGIAKRLHPAESGETIVVEKVLKSNPLLEAFGNAKTIRNDNSSRFGKFTQLQFNSDNCLVGAECRHYLLEKSRVVAQAAGERNYHIFYQLVSAKEDVFGFKEDTSPKEFRYLQDEKLILDGQTDLERYQVTRDALTTIGLSDKEQNELFSALCGILRLGQLDFVPLESNKDDASQAVAAASASESLTAEQIEQQKNEIEQCAKLLGVEVAALSKQLCSRTVKARQEVYCVPLSALHAGNNRDALAKEIYARVFGYLVRRVNYSISNSADRAASTPSYLHIDLLDIFGFESFEHNSFEQFCINFANEKLQQKFTLDVFKTVQEEYQQEGVAWEFVKYRDNQDMLDLLENSMGVMALLNEECVRPMGSDLSFVSKLVSLRESHPRLERARLSQMHFMLHHYAGPVTYDAEGFVEKNKDSLQTDLLELLGTSSNGLMSMVFSDDDNTAFMTDADLAVRAATMMETGRRSTVSRKTSTFMQETEKSAIKVQTAYRKYLSEKKYAKFRNAVIKIQSTLKMRKQVGKYHRLLSERKEQDAMETEVELLKHRLEDEKRARMEIEAENSSLQQELNQVRSSSVPSAESSIYESEGPPTFRNSSMRLSRIERESMDDGKLLDDSERMIDYLRKEVTKGRELIQMLSQENENLKAENKKIKDAYTAAGASFAALNQHNKQQSKANLRLMSTHAALIKSQEEKMKKYKKQVAELKEDLRMQRSVYSAELKARVAQQDVLLDIINLAESDGVSEDLLERMRAMAVDSKPSYENGRRSSEYTRPPTGRRSSSRTGRESEHRDKRSDTATSLGAVPVSVSVNSNPTRNERRATLDTIMNNPVPHGVSPQGEGMSPPDRGSLNRSSLYSEDGHRKSRIGGMFKKMFKKDE
ncbi:myosin-like protein [Phytophthora cinnamomi]|uniref:myosin-like protein n=1 Tax=Phytophthora cinnamomi TaxID=4785 RepID=UPI00355AAC34|nr:myosin-like protein [Phytophthora cinnamomi]